MRLTSRHRSSCRNASCCRRPSGAAPCRASSSRSRSPMRPRNGAAQMRGKLATIFTSSAATAVPCTRSCRHWRRRNAQVSPTRFHNSVHNAPAGYWHIASACREPSTSISCYDASFAAGLLEAAAQIATEEPGVLLIAYDLPYPAPLASVRPIKESFATALHLTPGGYAAQPRAARCRTGARMPPPRPAWTIPLWRSCGRQSRGAQPSGSDRAGSGAGRESCISTTSRETASRFRSRISRAMSGFGGAADTTAVGRC